MSFQLFRLDILFYQRILKSAAFYSYRLDGIWGPKTNQADLTYFAKGVEIQAPYGSFDRRSEDNIMSLIAPTQMLARRLLIILIDEGHDVRIISGTRTYSHQDSLFRIGR